MSLVVAGTPTDGLWASVYAGFGIRGGDVPATGTHGSSPVLGDLLFPADVDIELTWEIIGPPPTGTLVTYEDLTYTYDPPPATVNLYTSFTYRVRGGGVVLYDDVEAIVIGTPTNLVNVTALLVEAEASVVAASVDIALALSVTALLAEAEDSTVSAAVLIIAPAAPEELAVLCTLAETEASLVAAQVAIYDPAAISLQPGSRKVCMPDARRLRRTVYLREA